ncbi:potential fungal zinc cluster transcription factor [Pseudozyma hubeiensis SY62]|uniref:Potential fungal zinc cluster transcription factor n=1 Tax=Pseudozyma hubeiensis (strain SY62) TaxID=1305764 RepID=R9PF64_PSEHS|nr:potential fungal zinc cluster transcription factor [Pseudozyma hubeiensis SY62]GAC96730.1 potential fungal zinc cluster transcription factor [Pseudozyma hubeiensis SY62]
MAQRSLSSAYGVASASGDPLYDNSPRAIKDYDVQSQAQRATWDPSPSDPYADRQSAFQHQRPAPYPYEPRHPSDADSLRGSTAHYHHGAQHSHVHHHPYNNPSHAAGSLYASSSRQADLNHRHVSRAACLSCRSAKRKCDGAKPVCGPCALRGVKDGYPQDDGGCVYVASKRGGPRFKGVKGAEATKRKLDERDKGGNLRGGRDSNSHDDMHSQSPPEIASYLHSSTAPSTPLDGRAPVSIAHLDPSRTAPDSLGATAANLPSMDGPSDAFERERTALATRNLFRPDSAVSGGLFDDLSITNFDLLQKFSANEASVGLSLANFYHKLEELPKAGVLAMANVDERGSIEVDLSQALLQEIETANKSSAAVNSEQQARALLQDFYELVYPACPVLPPSGHLSSLAFHLSEDESSALLAAISACVALQLPQMEARRIVKGSLLFHDPDDHEAKAELLDLEHASRDEIAAYHAKSAEKLLLKKVALLARTSSFPSEAAKAMETAKFMPNSSGTPGGDIELVRIKLVATHTLLAHFHYGTSNSRRAFHHASQAWNHAQALNLDSSETVSTSPSWFSHTQKCEWARRAYWTCYTAATVMSCTGGFKPLSVTRDMPSDLGLLPNLLGDRSSWKVLVRGAQFVSRSYATLYDLDSYKARPENKTQDPAHQPREQRRKWEVIFERMQKVDADVMQYARSDPVWSDESCFEPSVGLSRRVEEFEEENEVRLSRSLRVAGKLMTSGALIILHRAQAFANARIFVAPTCGIPGACEDFSDTASDNGSRTRGGPDRLWHREAEGLPPSGKAAQSDEHSHGFDAPASSKVTTASRYKRSRSASSLSSSNAGSVSKSQVSSTSSGTEAAHATYTPCGIPVKFNSGPFEPSDSLDRCRFAAGVMYQQLAHINSSTFRLGRRESMALLPVEAVHGRENREQWSAPSLPPFSACSLVLAAYVLLMETLHAQIAAGLEEDLDFTNTDSLDVHEESLFQLSPILQPDPHRTAKVPQLAGRQAYMLAIKLRSCILQIEAALDKFSRAWEIAKGYAQEVKLLLEVNQSLFSGTVAQIKS